MFCFEGRTVMMGEHMHSPRPTRLKPAVSTVTTTSLPVAASLTVPMAHVSSSSVTHVTDEHGLPPTPTVMPL